MCYSEYLLLVTTVIPLKCFIHVCFFRTEFLRDSIPCRIFLLEQNDIRAFFNYIRGTLENNGSSSNTVDLVNVRSPKEFTGAIQLHQNIALNTPRDFNANKLSKIRGHLKI